MKRSFAFFLFFVIGACVFLGLDMFNAKAASPVQSAVTIRHPDDTIQLYAGPGMDDPLIREIPAGEFPKTVAYFGTQMAGGRVHHIRLDGDKTDYWVLGDQIDIAADRVVLSVTCEAGSERARGALGRGAGAQVVCK